MEWAISISILDVEFCLLYFKTIFSNEVLPSTKLSNSNVFEFITILFPSSL